MHLVGRGGDRGIDVATGVRRTGQHVAVEAPYRVFVRVECAVGVGERLEHVVLDGNGVGRLPGDGDRVGDDDGQHVAEVGGAPTHRDHHRPVLVDDADLQHSGDVGGGVDGVNPIESQGGGGVDGNDVGPGVVGQSERPVEQTGDSKVVDIAAVTQGQFRASYLTPRCRRPPAGRQRDAVLAQHLDGVEDLGVPGATAEVGAEAACRSRLVEVLALLVEQGLGAYQDAGRAEAALQGSGGRERGGEAVSLRRGQTLRGW